MRNNIEQLYEAGKRREGFVDMMRDPGFKAVVVDRDNIISRYRMIEERTGEFAPSTIFVIFAELERFTKTLEECATEQDKLFFWFKNSWKYKQLPEEFTEDVFISDLANACLVAAFSKKKFNEYMSAMKNERDLQYRMKIYHDRGFAEGREEGEKKGREEGLAEGEKKGRAEGLAEGRKEGEMERNIAIARNMFAQGLAIETISQCVGLSIEELNAIK